MKFNVNQQDLQQALNYCQGVIEKRSTLQILSNVLLDASNANLWDHSALEALDSQTTKFRQAGKTLGLKNVQPESMKIIQRAKKVYEINIVE